MKRYSIFVSFCFLWFNVIIYVALFLQLNTYTRMCPLLEIGSGVPSAGLQSSSEAVSGRHKEVPASDD